MGEGQGWAHRSAGLVLGLGLLGCVSNPVQVGEESAELLAPGIAELQRRAAETRIDEAAAYRDGVWDPAYFDRLIPSEGLEIEGLRRRHARPGVGVPLVGLRENPGGAEPYLPPEGITRPVTAVRTASPDGGTAWRLLDPTVHARIDTPEGPRDLAADFTAPYALLVSRTRFASLEITATLRYSEIEERAGIFLIDRYDPDRIPLLMVHGLVSSPLTWRELTNDVLGDADLQRRYQVWHAVYPTGVPYLHAAADFRDAWLEMRRTLDPEGRHLASHHRVIVAHSKGGLLTKTLVADSGTRLWDAAFTAPPGALSASEADLAEMRRFLFFEHDPSVRRAVFIATPHRGSRLADNPLARMVASWIALPFDDAGPFERVLDQNPDHLTTSFQRRRFTGLPTGPRALSQQDPLIGTLGALPVDPLVPFHTILGRAEADGASDGVVEHASSRLEGAASELVVEDAGHDVHQHPEAIAEVLRILREHAASLEAQRNPVRPGVDGGDGVGDLRGEQDSAG